MVVCFFASHSVISFDSSSYLNIFPAIIKSFPLKHHFVLMKFIYLSCRAVRDDFSYRSCKMEKINEIIQKKADCLHRSQEGCKMETYYHRILAKRRTFFCYHTYSHPFYSLDSLSTTSIIVIKAAGAKAAAVMSRAYHRQIQQTKTLKAMRLFDTKHLLFHRFFMLPIKNSYTCAFRYVHGECAFFHVVT